MKFHFNVSPMKDATVSDGQPLLTADIPSNVSPMLNATVSDGQPLLTADIPSNVSPMLDATVSDGQPRLMADIPTDADTVNPSESLGKLNSRRPTTTEERTQSSPLYKRAITTPSSVVAFDYGTGSSFQAWGEDGHVVFKWDRHDEHSGGVRSADATNFQRTKYKLEKLYGMGYRVFLCEAPSITSSGFPITLATKFLEDHPDAEIWVCRSTAGKYEENKHEKTLTANHIRSAEILYNLPAYRFRRWTGKSAEVLRQTTSVRTQLRGGIPLDDTAYTGKDAEFFLSLIEPYEGSAFEFTSTEREVMRSPVGVVPVIRAALDALDQRGGKALFGKIMSLHAHGHPSYYRRGWWLMAHEYMKLRGWTDTSSANGKLGGTSDQRWEAQKFASKLAFKIRRFVVDHPNLVNGDLRGAYDE